MLSRSAWSNILLTAFCVLALVMGIALVTMMPARGDFDPKGPVRWVGIVGGVPRICDGVLLLSFSLQRQDKHGIWHFELDNGPDDAVILEGHYVGKKYGPDGRWIELPDVGSGGEGNLRWPVKKGLGAPDAVRVVRVDGGGTSEALPPSAGCPA